MLLSQKVTIHDVDDAEAFVRAAIRDSRVRLSPDDMEELLAEGLRIMVVLGNNYEPGRNGLDPASSRFSGYAAKYLRVKLGDSNRRLQGAKLEVQPDGTRKARFNPKMASLDAIVAVNPDAVDRSLQSNDEYDSDMANTLRDALERRWQYDRETTVKVGVILGAGYLLPDAVKALHIEHEEGLECVERIRRVAHELQEES